MPTAERGASAGSRAPLRASPNAVPMASLVDRARFCPVPLGARENEPSTMPAPFETLRPGALVLGLDPSGPAEILSATAYGADAVSLVFRVNGRVAERLVLRGEEEGFRLAEPGRAFALDADGGSFRLAAEALRIRLAHLFDPFLAVSSSQIEPLPHQITAVYGEMLPRQPLLPSAMLAAAPEQAGVRSGAGEGACILRQPTHEKLVAVPHPSAQRMAEIQPCRE